MRLRSAGVGFGAKRKCASFRVILSSREYGNVCGAQRPRVFSRRALIVVDEAEDGEEEQRTGKKKEKERAARLL